ncbi:MAG: hypothetical protein ABSB23_22490 [Bryobacteraceae bacterium]
MVAFEQSAPSEHFVYHDAEGPDVGALVHGLTAGLLRAHVGGGAQDHSGLRRAHADGWRILGLHGRRPAYLRQAEIQNLNRAVGLDLDVAGFEVAVNYVLDVRRLEGVSDLARDRQRFFEWYRASCNAVCEGGTFHQLQHEIVGADVVQRANVGMVQGRNRTGFALEALTETLGGDLDGDLPF